MFGKKLNSITINKAYGRVLKTSNLDIYERSLLNLVLRNAPLKEGEHDYAVAQIYSNATLAKLVGCSKERIRQAKESLQARGILFVDEHTWEEYRTPNGKRIKPQTVQSIKATAEFIKYLIGDTISWIFDYCKDFFMKLKKRKEAKFPSKKYAEVQGNLWTEDDWVNAEQKKIKAKELEEQDRIFERAFREQQRKKILIEALQRKDEIILKPWTDAVTEIVKTLVRSGMAIVEVANLLTSQKYVPDVNAGLKLIEQKLSG
jgi:hypothetical protein